jgi:hypothetical protein
MKFYRIKQIGENQFIPQVAECWFDRILGFWHGIDIINNRTLSIEEYQRKWCVSATLEHAKYVVEVYKKTPFNFNFKYPKYYKA